MSAKDAARAIAAGRVVFGLIMLVAPKLMRRWLGDAVDTPGGQVAIRGLGARDLLLGALTLHVIPHGAQGARSVGMCAMADVADVTATVLARDALGGQAVAVTAVVGGGAAVAGFATSAAMLRD